MSGVNFTNILHAAFTCVDPKSAKNTVKLSVISALLGSDSIKTACKTSVNTTPGDNNHLLTGHTSENTSIQVRKPSSSKYRVCQRMWPS